MARPRYSDSSNGPMAFTIQSYLMADTNAIVFPTSNAHHAQPSPRRNAVTAMATDIMPKAALKTPYILKRTMMYLAVIGDVLASSDQEPFEKPS